MKKFLLLTLVFVVGMIIFPGSAKAQFYSGYIYGNNALMNYAMASQRARQMRSKHSTRNSRRRVSSKRKSANRNSRRVSMIQNLIEPEIFVSDLPKKTLIG